MLSVNCCSGFLDSGSPEGTIQQIANISCYRAKPKSSSNSYVVIATDVFGFTVPNIRLIADAFANNGLNVIIPDYFNGGEPPADLMTDVQGVMAKESPLTLWGKMYSVFRTLYYFIPFLLRFSSTGSAAIVKKVVNELRTQEGENIKVGVIGYCWGGEVAVKLGHLENFVDAICVNHPGNLKYPRDITDIKCPAYFVLAGIDIFVPPKCVEVIKKVAASRADSMAVKVFDDQIHGFAVRGNENDINVKTARSEAFESAYEFLVKHLK